MFYSAFVRVNEDSLLPALPGGPPLLREHRLYQADWLLRYYGFQAGELLSEGQPNFNVLLDPKCDWALRHLDRFPVEANRADYYTLLRVPGVGVRSARRIVEARRHGTLDFQDLKKFGRGVKAGHVFSDLRRENVCLVPPGSGCHRGRFGGGGEEKSLGYHCLACIPPDEPVRRFSYNCTAHSGGRCGCCFWGDVMDVYVCQNDFESILSGIYDAGRSGKRSGDQRLEIAGEREPDYSAAIWR